MKINQKFIQVLALFLFFTVNSFGQNLPYMHFKMLKNDTLHFYMQSYMPVVELVYPNSGNLDNVAPASDSTSPPTHHLRYFPNTDFTGRDHIILEYRGNPGTAWDNWAFKRTIIDIDVMNSMLNAQNDIAFVNTNSPGDTLDILANDSTSADSLFIEKILNVNNGTVTIVEDKVVFKPDSNFTGTTFFNYKVGDNAGTVELGHVIIKVADENAIPDTLNYYITNTTALPIILTESGFQIDSIFTPQLGELNFDNDPELIYSPDVDSTGIDEFHLVTSSDTIVVFVEIYEGLDDGRVILDDDVYTGLNTEVSFNVKDNDYKKNTFSLSYTDVENGTLQYSGQGNFTYTPNEGFNGVDEFTYTVQLSFNYYQTATVRIYVDNFYPRNYDSYVIRMSKNSQYVLNYDIPIDGYYFDLHAAPLEGSVDIYNDWDTVNVNCEDITGDKFIVYTPPVDYTGEDRFELEYCPPDDSCVVIKVIAQIYDEQADTLCSCAASSCIWPGDTDNNGKVDAKDIIPVGLYLGETGPQRSYSTINWLGLNAEDWEKSQVDNNVNLNHTDTDGDGIITTADSNKILTYYNNSHNIFTDVVVHQPEFPIYLVPDQTEVDSGEVLTLSIIAGDEEDPAKEINGIAYTLSLQSYFADSSSFHHRFLTDSWLANGSASVQLSNQYQTGQVDAAFSRIGFSGVTGIGKIATCDFIVEDDIDGIKRSFEYLEKIPIKIHLTGIVIAKGNGKTFRAPDVETTVYLRLKRNTTKNKPTKVFVYPNPTHNNVDVFVDGSERITGYNIFNSLGMLMDIESIDNKQKHTIDLTGYSNGIYFIEVFTNKNKKYTKKIEVIK